MSNTIFLYNTLTRQKEKFIPLVSGKVKVYSCGPTVYSDPHIGNMRAYVFADILRQTLKHVGNYDVTHITNITDVGHLTDDGDHGEDKMEKWARKEGISVWDIARKYEENFLKYADALHIERFDRYTRATEHIAEQIEMVKQLIKKWYTYLIEWDGIYMDTCQIDDYGKLAQLDIKGMCSHHREEWAQIDSSKKRQITDFALRKFSPKDEQRAMEWIFSSHEMQYDSWCWERLSSSEEATSSSLQKDQKVQNIVWDRSGTLIVSSTSHSHSLLKAGATTVSRDSLTEKEEETRWFPWWHIECSAMSTKYLWKQFDIHTGGVDHIPVHHTNEIAQAECALWLVEENKNRVNYRMHGQFLQIDGWKLSKSKGDDLSVAGIVAQWYDPLDLRYFYLTAHYRSFLDFTWGALDAAKKSRENMIKKINWKLKAESVKQLHLHNTGKVYHALSEAMADDLDTVTCLSLMHGALSWSEDDIKDVLFFDEQVTKLWLCEGICILEEQQNIVIPAEIIALVEQRLEAKENKNWQEADKLRDALKDLWWEVKDTAEGYELKKL